MSTITTKYSELFSVSVTQLFYENRISVNYSVIPELDFTFMATQETVELMERMNLIFRNMESIGGFIVLAHSKSKAGANDVLRFPAKKSDKLSFLMRFKTPYFINYTDLPITTAADSLFYFSNDIVDPAALRSGLHLSKDEAGVNANDVIKKAGGVYRYQHSMPLTWSQAKVKHLLTGDEITAQSLLNENGQASLIFNLSALPLGKCRLFINGDVQDEFYNLGQYNHDNVFALLELQLSPTLDANYRIIEADKSLTPVRPHYNICFINRKTIWCYTIKLQTNGLLYNEMAALSPLEKADFLNRLKIISNDSNITFTQFYADDTTIIFRSDKPIALREKYISSSSMKSLNLTLKKFTGLPTKETVVKAHLPYPSALIDATNYPSIYSIIFLTL